MKTGMQKQSATRGLEHQGTYLMSCLRLDTVSRFDEVNISSFKHFGV